MYLGEGRFSAMTPQTLAFVDGQPMGTLLCRWCRTPMLGIGDPPAPGERPVARLYVCCGCDLPTDPREVTT
jgi:hypothetical protein